MRTEKIVVIDDEIKSLQRTNAALYEMHFRDIQLFDSPDEFLESIKPREWIDLIITDVKMGAVFGNEMIESARDSGLDCSVPVIYMSRLEPLRHDGVFFEKRLDAEGFIPAMQATVRSILGA